MVKIFCGNVSQRATGDDLRYLFEKYGKVTEAIVIEGKEFGFVHMDNKDEADEAVIDTNGIELKGRAIHVELSHGGRRDRDRRESTPNRYNDRSRADRRDRRQQQSHYDRPSYQPRYNSNDYRNAHANDGYNGINRRSRDRHIRYPITSAPRSSNGYSASYDRRHAPDSVRRSSPPFRDRHNVSKYHPY